MKISKGQTVRQDWDDVRSWNYKLPGIGKYESVVYAELDGDHGQVKTKDVERVYFILDGTGSFDILGETINVAKDDIITIPPNTTYNYHPTGDTTLKVLLFMELWDN